MRPPPPLPPPPLPPTASHRNHCCRIRHAPTPLPEQVCDFGLARRFDGSATGGGPAGSVVAADLASLPGPVGASSIEGGYTPKVVTLWYRAPELLLGTRHYGSSADMWSVGCMLGELLLNRPLLPGDTELKQLHLICELLGTPHARIWPGFDALPLASKMTLPEYQYNELPSRFVKLAPSNATLDLLNGLLTYDPTKRWSATQAQAHPFFRERPQPLRREGMRRFSSANPPRAPGGGGGGAAAAGASVSASGGGGSKGGSQASSGTKRPNNVLAGGALAFIPPPKRPSLGGGGSGTTNRTVCAQTLEDEAAASAGTGSTGSASGGGSASQHGGAAAVRAGGAPPPANHVPVRVASPASVVVSSQRQC